MPGTLQADNTSGGNKRGQESLSLYLEPGFGSDCLPAPFLVPDTTRFTMRSLKHSRRTDRGPKMTYRKTASFPGCRQPCHSRRSGQDRARRPCGKDHSTTEPIRHCARISHSAGCRSCLYLRRTEYHRRFFGRSSGAVKRSGRFYATRGTDGLIASCSKCSHSSSCSCGSPYKKPPVLISYLHV